MHNSTGRPKRPASLRKPHLPQLLPPLPSATGRQKGPQIPATQTTSRGRCSAGPALGRRTRRARRPGQGHVAALACGSIGHMTELTDVSGAFGYGDSILVGERVRLRGVRDDDLPTLAKWQMDPGRMATLSGWVAPPSEAAAKERIAKWSANEEDDLGFAIETLDDPPVLLGNIGLWGARPRTGARRSGSPSAVRTSVVAMARTRCASSSTTGSARWACTAFSSVWPRSTPPGSAPTRRRGSSRRAAIASRCCTTGAGTTRC
jgi:Acetyltransferase (GNAT) domain